MSEAQKDTHTLLHTLEIPPKIEIKMLLLFLF